MQAARAALLSGSSLRPLRDMHRGKIHRLVFAGTGAMMSPTSVQQGQPIAGICHAVVLERSEANYLNAFWVGGLICALCQVLIDKTKLTPALFLVSLVVLHVLGVILQGLGWYQAARLRRCRRDCAAARLLDTRWQRRCQQLRKAACSACSPAA